MNTNTSMLATLIEKVDALTKSHVQLKQSYDADISIIKSALSASVIEDIRIDNKFTLVASNTKAYIAGIATAFTFLGALFGTALTYFFGVK